MATSQTKPQSEIPWHKASTFLLLLISLGTIAYTVLVTKELAASIAHLKTEVTRLESDCTQQSGNNLHANEHTTFRSKCKITSHLTYSETLCEKTANCFIHHLGKINPCRAGIRRVNKAISVDTSLEP